MRLRLRALLRAMRRRKATLVCQTLIRIDRPRPCEQHPGWGRSKGIAVSRVTSCPSTVIGAGVGATSPRMHFRQTDCRCPNRDVTQLLSSLVLIVSVSGRSHLFGPEGLV